MTDLYASEEETNTLIQPDTRTPEQKKAAKLADKNWMNEQGAEPQRAWVGLTPQERDEIQQECYGKVPHHVAFHHAIEAKLKEKNA